MNCAWTLAHTRPLGRVVSLKFSGRRKPALLFIVRLLSVAILVLNLFSCRAQIRGAETIQSDVFLAYLQKEREALPAATVASALSGISRKGMVATDMHDLGVAQARNLELDHAEETLMGLVSVYRSFIPGYTTLARLYFICQEPERSRRIFELLAREKSVPDTTLLESGRILESQGRYAEARLLYEALMAADRQTAAAASWLGRRLLAEGHRSAALDFFRAAVKADPSLNEARYAAAWIHFEAGNFSLAAGYAGDSVDPDMLLLKARSLTALGRNDEALASIRKIPAAGRNAEIIELEGRIRLDQDFSADLSSLLLEVKEQERASLLRSWYGTTDAEAVERARNQLKRPY